jgi:hypothetical protein
VQPKRDEIPAYAGMTGSGKDWGSTLSNAKVFLDRFNDHD